MAETNPIQKQIHHLVSAHRVVLFMKGTRSAPQCGFSATVVTVLDDLVPAYHTVDVIADPAMRDGVKVFSEWPTIPQLYVDGKFVGGCDIVKEMYASGDLAKLLGVTPAAVAIPKITISPAAAGAFLDAASAAGDEVLHLEISPRFQHDLYFAPRAEGDVAVDTGQITIYVDRSSARRAGGISIDFVKGPNGAGFKIDNPNEPARVKDISPGELKEMLDRGAPVHLFDVRTEHERTLASIEGARHFNEAAQDFLSTLDRDAPVVFHCHHGGRSLAAAEHYVAAGFRNVYNLKGGIDAWSLIVDRSVPRY
jgi:monothiol glutaredoxin